jgi:ribonuclease HI
MKLIIHTDGGARGNPGPAAIGVVIEDVNEVGPSTSSGRASKTQELAQFGKRIGETTNNVAEYTGVLEALLWVKENIKEPMDDTKFFLDSTLVVNQLNGLYKVKESHLRELFTKVRLLEQEIGGQVKYFYIPREQNSRADFFVNKALDEKK